MRFQDVSTPAGIAQPRTYTHGVTVGDYDNDGFADLLITGYGCPQLLHNQGDGTFADMTLPAGLTDTLWSTSAAWADLNADGNLDLYLAHYVDWSWKKHPKCPGVVPGTFDLCVRGTLTPCRISCTSATATARFTTPVRRRASIPAARAWGS